MTGAPSSHSDGRWIEIWFRTLLVCAMALPMLVLYTVSALGPFLAPDLDIDPSQLAYLITSAFGVAAVLSLWAGAVVDRIGSRRALQLLFLTIAVAFSFTLIVPNFAGLVAAVAICGIAQALANPVTNLLIAQRVAAKKRAKLVGLKQSGVQLAALFAGLVLPAVALTWGWRSAFGILVPLALLFAFTAYHVTPKTHEQQKQGLKLSRPNALLLYLMSIQFCLALALSAFVTFLPTFATQQGMAPAMAGALIALFGGAGMLSRIVLTPLTAKLKEESWMLLSLNAASALAIVVTMQAAPGSHWPLWLGAIGVGLTAVATNAIAMSMLIKDAAFGVVTSASAYVSVAFFGGFALGPLIYGSVLSATPNGSFLGWQITIGILILACVLALLLARKRHKVRTLCPC